MKEALGFDDVLCVPKYSEVTSRKNVDISVSWGKLKFPSVCMAANMPTVIDLASACEMLWSNIVPVFHRMESSAETAEKIIDLKNDFYSPIGASIGVKEGWKSSSKELIEAGADFIVLDVAHGNQKRVAEVAKAFVKEFSEVNLIVGNFATYPEISVFEDLLENPLVGWKIGVGSGAACSTRIKTGHGLPTLTSVYMFIEHAKNINMPIPFLIADGGIKNPGDICKSLSVGANMVMLGSMLSATKQSPGQTIRGVDGKLYKMYAGNASRTIKSESGDITEFIEGVEALVPLKGDFRSVALSIFDGIRSGYSYSGAANTEEFRQKSSIVKISAASNKESYPHILK